MKDRFPSLPPGTTPKDIDDHFGVQEYTDYIYYTNATVTVSVALPRDASEQDVKDRVIERLNDKPPDDVIEVEIAESEPSP